MKPPSKGEEEEIIVKKTSNDALTIDEQTFTFDSIADPDSTQTGSGKTYTMWGPANGLLEEHLSGDQRGLTPRVFELLFARISEEQAKHAERQLLNYQCCCSFLEIYNEQITDLLDPSQKNLMIREDVKSGVYVENLTEEYAKNLNDLSKLLIKGLANRRTGATSVNAESSRSHCVFTCVVESHCKDSSDKGQPTAISHSVRDQDEAEKHRKRKRPKIRSGTVNQQEEEQPQVEQRNISPDMNHVDAPLSLSPFNELAFDSITLPEFDSYSFDGD